MAVSANLFNDRLPDFRGRLIKLMRALEEDVSDHTVVLGYVGLAIVIPRHQASPVFIHRA